MVTTFARRSGYLLAVATMLVLMAPISAKANGCAVKTGKLTCGDNAEAVALAMASGDTRLLFARPEQFKAAFDGKPYKRELFRRSLEAQRRQVERFGRNARQAFDKNRIDVDEYNKRNTIYEIAIRNYGEGYWFYKNLRWQSN